MNKLIIFVSICQQGRLCLWKNLLRRYTCCMRIIFCPFFNPDIYFNGSLPNFNKSRSNWFYVSLKYSMFLNFSHFILILFLSIQSWQLSSVLGHSFSNKNFFAIVYGLFLSNRISESICSVFELMPSFYQRVW